MGKFIRYDEKGNEVFFDYGIDAREAVATGRFFETPPEGIVAKKDVDAAPEAVKKKGRPVKSEVALDAEDSEIAGTVLEDVIAEAAQVADAKE